MLGWMLALWCAAPAAAAPVTIQHPARLRDAAGGPLEGSDRLELRLYRGDGSQVWADVFDPVHASGDVSVALGGGAPLDGDLFAEPLWLGIAVDGGAELPLRQALHAVPRAAWLSADAVGQIEWPDREILIVKRTANRMRHTSTNAGFNRADGANGTIRSNHVASYAIRFRRNDEASFSNLQSVTNSCNASGNCLLGGYDASSRWTIILGIGGYGRNNLFAQDSACQTHPSTSARRALNSGRFSDPWNQDGHADIG
jgi:hypothetical protein